MPLKVVFHKERFLKDWKENPKSFIPLIVPVSLMVLGLVLMFN